MSPIVRAAAFFAVAACAAAPPPPPVAVDPNAPPGANAGGPFVVDPQPKNAPEVVSAAADSGAGETPAVPNAPPPVSAPPVPGRTVEECGMLAKFVAPRVNGEIPWMLDPIGDKAKKKSPIQVAFKKCFDAAKQSDPTQVVAISMEHKPRGTQHRVCVKVTREDGREEVTTGMARCMVQAIKDHAGR